MKTCVAIRHVAFEDLDGLAPILAACGFDTTMIEAPTAEPSQILDLSPDLLVILGGPIGVYDEADYPFLTAEIALLKARLDADRPTLGICLGAQLMARALGAQVFSNPNGKEIGWSPLTLSEAGQNSELATLGQADVLHWHGDTFDLPHGAQLLASTTKTQNQAFAWGQCGLGLQFHVEATQIGLERWYVGHTGEISATDGISVPSLRRDTARSAPKIEILGAKMLGQWLDRVCG